MKGGGGAIIGYVLGGAVIIPFILYLISIVFYKSNKVTEAILNQYIENSEEIKVDSAGNVSYWESSRSNGKLGIQSIKITYFLAKNNTGTQYYPCFIFNSKKFHKYFKLIGLSEYIYDPPWDKSIVMTVNKEDFNNPAYGTINNPVPVLKFIGADKSVRSDNKDYDRAYMDTVYHKNVEMYLKYVMPKKEFKARFGK